jgi:hypothetical protein
MLKRDSKTGSSSGEGDGHGEERSALAEDKSRDSVDQHFLKEMIRDRLPLEGIKSERASASSIRMSNTGSSSGSPHWVLL